ncbi:MAG: hypothetical protein ACRDXB_21690, partial [Actinomycetes bacterium]
MRLPRPKDNESMKPHTYTTYSIGCGIAWAIVWSIIGTTRPQARSPVLLFFAGWLAGWTSATIARYVYPPPQTGRGIRTRHRTVPDQL